MKTNRVERIFGVLILPVLAIIAASGAFTGPAAAEMSETELRLQALEEKVKASEDNLRVFYKDGLKFEAAGGDFKFQIGGRIMNDWAFFDASDEFANQFAEPEDGTEFRRARFFMSGLLYNQVEYKLQLDFAGSEVAFKDAYIGLVDIPVVQNVLVGHFKEPFSLEELTSSKYITFMERSLANAFSPGRNMGFAAYDNEALDKRMTWAIGVFRPTGDDAEIQDNSGYNLTARLTATPITEDKGRKLVHLGVACSFVNPEDNLGPVQFRSRPEAHLTSRYVDTGNFLADDYSLYGLEAAAVWNSLSVQGEYILADVDSSATGDPTVDGYYVEASYYLTGENRSYKHGAFGRTKVKRNFLQNGGLGAWQVALRYSSIDLNDAGLTCTRCGQEDNVTVGVNWHLNNNTRVMLNYVNADIEGGAGQDFGNLDIFQTRFQIDF